jgi:hypothetical protein
LVSIVASKLYFSAANKVLTDKRMRLDEKVFSDSDFVEGLRRCRKYASKQVVNVLN